MRALCCRNKLARIHRMRLRLRTDPAWRSGTNFTGYPCRFKRSMQEGSRRHRVSLPADILNERHTIGGLAALLPMEEFVAADYFLFLMGELPPGEGSHFSFSWRPWSTIYLHGTPVFLRNAERKQIAKELMKLFGIDSAEELGRRGNEHRRQRDVAVSQKNRLRDGAGEVRRLVRTLPVSTNFTEKLGLCYSRPKTLFDCSSPSDPRHRHVWPG